MGAGSERIAVETGGLVVHANDITAGIRRVAHASDAYYLLGYSSTNRAADGRFRKIEVKLAPSAKVAPGIEIRARRGYYAARADARPPEAKALLADALNSPLDQTAIPLRLTAHFQGTADDGKVRCLLVGEVGVGSLAFEEQDGRSLASLDLAFGTMGAGEDGWSAPKQQRADMKLLPATLERVRRDGYVVREEMTLGAGPGLVKLVVRDPKSGRVGSITTRIDVPDPAAFRISTPIVTDLAEPGAKGEGPRALAIARRDFAVGGRLFVSFDIFGTRGAPGDRRPKVTARFEVVRSDGEVFASVPPRTVEPAADGGLHRFFAVSLEKARPGEHEVIVEVIDEVSGKTVLWTETFQVVTAS
jgi:hypothetical protein